ncbi:MAG: hypothetical protein HeimC3_48210 [Candidatus Heimdallarchaeota archaeon LC_3]|nr:MAG: hypothetical protein HeimC3_48210 [Candidatus Heimdallarchaeota archaeon LC_3]
MEFSFIVKGDKENFTFYNFFSKSFSKSTHLILSGHGSDFHEKILFLNGPDWDMWIVKTDEKGVLEWNETYGGSGNQIIHSAIQVSDGEIVVSLIMITHETPQKICLIFKNSSRPTFYVFY